MRDAAAQFRAKAQRCRHVLKKTVDPESIVQLQTWIRKFEEKAAEAEQRAPTATIPRRRWPVDRSASKKLCNGRPASGTAGRFRLASPT